MAIVLSAFPGNQTRIDSCMWSTSHMLNLLRASFPEENITFAVSEEIRYAVYDITEYASTLWFYFYILKPFIAK